MTTYAHGAFCWHEIMTRDAAAARDFYANLLGYSVQEVPMPWGEGTYTMLAVGDGTVAGIVEMQGESFDGVPPHWMAYVWVDDVDATAKSAAAIGASVLHGPMDIPGVGRMAVLMDPSGAAISIFHGTGHRGAADVGLSQGGVTWNELMTPNGPQAEAFYTTIFGWDPHPQEMPGVDYTIYRLGEKDAAGQMVMQGPDWEGVPPHWMPYVTVVDCDATLARATALGGEVRVPGTDIPNIGRFGILADPLGAHFAVIELRTGQ